MKDFLTECRERAKDCPNFDGCPSRWVFITRLESKEFKEYCITEEKKCPLPTDTPAKT